MDLENFESIFFNNTNIVFQPLTLSIIISILIMILLLFFSALISGSEVAFFSLSPQQLSELEDKSTTKTRKIIRLLGIPEQLLATILIANNFVNVGIVILSSFITNGLVDFTNSPTMAFIFQVIVITFLLLLFGEIIPKVYATHYAIRFSSFMASPLHFLEKLCRPFASILIRSTSIVNKRISKKNNISMTDLSQALELTTDETTQEKEILEGIVKFGNINVEEIMKARVDTVAVDIRVHFSKLKAIIIESGYSRIPVYDKSFDNIRGILYVKDLLPHIDKGNTFRWQSIIRPPYFVPETKKINDLLEEFQTKKMHMAIVVDEYGGTSGVVTLEDILEEIVGDISDEMDEERPPFTLEEDGSYIFEGKTLLNDFFKIVNAQEEYFDSIKGDADTLAGLILEMKGAIPKKREEFTHRNYTFTIEAVDNRRIKKIRFRILKTMPDRENSNNH